MYTDYYSFTASLFQNSAYLPFVCLFVCLFTLCVCVHACFSGCTLKSEDSLCKWILPFYLYVDCGNWTKVFRLNSKCLSYLNHLAGPALVNIEFCFSLSAVRLLDWFLLGEVIFLTEKPCQPQLHFPHTCFSTFSVFTFHSSRDIHRSITMASFLYGIEDWSLSPHAYTVIFLTHWTISTVQTAVYFAAIYLGTTPPWDI